MKLHTHDEGAPCRNMENLLQGVADGSVRGVKKAYAVWHASQCHHCGNFLIRLRLTLEALRSSRERETSTESMERLKSKIRELSPR